MNTLTTFQLNKSFTRIEGEESTYRFKGNPSILLRLHKDSPLPFGICVYDFPSGSEVPVANLATFDLALSVARHLNA